MIPSRDPDIHRVFQYTDLDGNSNKFWAISAWWGGGERWMLKTEFGRTGVAKQVHVKHTTEPRINSLIKSKLRKGYREVIRCRDIDQSVLSGKVGDLVQSIFGEAREHIKTYLSTSVESLSPEQVAEGRRLLTELQYTWSGNLRNRARLIALAQDYYKAIPTKLPHRIVADDVIRSLCSDFREQEERLDQLEAAVALDAIGARIVESEDADQIAKCFYDSVRHDEFRSARVVDVYDVMVLRNKGKFTLNVGNITPLYHGTRGCNLRHILRSGLVLPKTRANGWMFGPGIYFADSASKSMHYSSGGVKALLVADVALGAVYVADDQMPELKSPPTGHDSVMGQGSHTRSMHWGGKLRHNEYIVYRESQQRLSHLIVWR